MEIKHYLNGEEIELSEDDTQCPSCERDDFAGVRGLRVHHSQTHNTKIKKYGIRDCAWCGETVKVRPSNAEKAARSFCRDKDCRRQWRGENRSGEDHYNWSQVEVECDWCGDTLLRQPNVVETNTYNFCRDKNCQSEWVSENKSGRTTITGWKEWKSHVRGVVKLWNEPLVVWRNRNISFVQWRTARRSGYLNTTAVRTIHNGKSGSRCRVHGAKKL